MRGRGPRPHPLAFPPPSLFLPESPLAACPRDRAAREPAVRQDWTTLLPLGRRPARDWPRCRRGFESRPRPGRVLPKCHVGPGCSVKSRLRAPAGALVLGRRLLGPLGGSRRVWKPARDVRCGSPRGSTSGQEARLSLGGVASRPAGGRLWLRAEEPVERPGQRLRRDGGGGGRCPRRSRSRC